MRSSQLLVRRTIGILGVAMANILVTHVAYAQPTYWADNGHYYEFVETTAISWHDAKAAAQTAVHLGWSGHLATITSSAENAFALSVVSTPSINPWIGGLQPSGSPEPAGNWQWVTGELFGYTNWLGGEPNNNATNPVGYEDTMQMDGINGQWNDLYGTATNQGYVIEYGPPLATFQPGVNGYSGTVDTTLTEGLATSQGALGHVAVDGSYGGSEPDHGLLRFDGIIGSASGAIPRWAAVSSATLSVDVDLTASSGDNTVHRMLMPWDEDDVWDDWVGGITYICHWDMLCWQMEVMLKKR